MGFWEWVISIWVILGGIIYVFGKATEHMDIEWEDVWYFAKKILIFCLTWLFMPLIIIYGIWQDDKWEKAQKAKAVK